ncbi:MAG: KOW motif-containing protein [Anaerolineales bacterium]|nr:KOW motif-containing protein [Anaerolineales bacterium]QYK51092.1 MAG: KOW motif-containing protein [Anaerolineales bacterium]
MLAPITYIQPLTTLRRTRQLPVEGLITVSLGDRLRGTDVIARTGLHKQHIMLDAARALGAPASRVSKLIQRVVGEEVEEGAILAGSRGLASRQLRAPAAGKIAAISEGQILLQISDASAQVQARVPGLVIDIDPGQSVTLECICAWVQCLWGNDLVGEGNLHMVADGPQHQLTADQIDMSLRGAILVAGHCSQRQALELAGQVPIRGLILGSLATRLLPVAEKMEYPIAVLEGFGKIPFNGDAFKLLSMHNGAATTLNAQANNPHSGERPEIIIPLTDAGHPPQPVEIQSFRIGQTVRVLSGKYKGQLGEIIELRGNVIYESQLRGPAAELTLAGGGRGRVPLANLELLG